MQQTAAALRPCFCRLALRFHTGRILFTHIRRPPFPLDFAARGVGGWEECKGGKSTSEWGQQHSMSQPWGCMQSSSQVCIVRGLPPLLQLLAAQSCECAILRASSSFHDKHSKYRGEDRTGDVVSMTVALLLWSTVHVIVATAWWQSFVYLVETDWARTAADKTSIRGSSRVCRMFLVSQSKRVCTERHTWRIHVIDKLKRSTTFVC